MTIKEYMRKVESAKMTPKDSAGASFTDAMMETTEIWSNDACVGYFLLSLIHISAGRSRSVKIISKMGGKLKGEAKI